MWVQDDWVQPDWIDSSGDIIAGAGYELTIAGELTAIQPGWRITAPANGIGTMQFEVISLDGSYVPGRDAEVIFTEDGVRIFGGTVYTVRERGLANEPVTRLVSEVSAQDFNALAARYYMGAVIPAGTLKEALEQVLPHLTGVTLDPAQVDGPALPDLNFSDAWLVQAILDQLATLTGYVWEIDYDQVLRMFVPGTLTAPFNITAGDGSIVGDVTSEPSVVKYANQIIVWGGGVQSIAEDLAEIALHGQWQMVVKAPDATTQAEVDALSAAVLAASLPFAKKITYETYGRGLLPGQTQTINIPQRHLNNTFLLTDVESRGMEARAAAYLVRRSVSAIEGVVYQTGWRETIKSWGGSGGGLTLPSLAGGTGGVSSARFAYFLGGSGLDFVQSPTPTWVAASPILVQLNTVARGSSLALVTARLRALDAGVSVQARLFDYTDMVVCPGVSALVTSTSWSTPPPQFTVTLTAGSHFYGLQLLPGTANAEVGSVAYVE